MAYTAVPYYDAGAGLSVIEERSALLATPWQGHVLAGDMLAGKPLGDWEKEAARHTPTRRSPEALYWVMVLQALGVAVIQVVRLVTIPLLEISALVRSPDSWAALSGGPHSLEADAAKLLEAILIFALLMTVGTLLIVLIAVSAHLLGYGARKWRSLKRIVGIELLALCWSLLDLHLTRRRFTSARYSWAAPAVIVAMMTATILTAAVTLVKNKRRLSWTERDQQHQQEEKSVSWVVGKGQP